MNPISEFIESGVLELYVMGVATPEDVAALEQMVVTYPEVKEELDKISKTLEQYAQAHAVRPRSSVKALLMATIDYMERMKEGELPESPPILTPESKISDFKKWIDENDTSLPEDADAIYAKIIGYTPTATTAIVWLKDKSDQEVHHDEYERFLILEGTCRLMVADKVNELSAGDFFSIPLHAPHQLIVTSEVPCKAILQRLSID